MQVFKKILFLCSLVVAFFLIYTARVYPQSELITVIVSLGYVGMFVSGVLYGYSITTAIGIALLLIFGGSNQIFLVALLGGLGAAFSNFLLFGTIRNISSGNYIANTPRRFKTFIQWMKQQKAQWILLGIGMLGFLLPIPDEIGVSLMGLSRLTLTRFLLLSVFFNTLGILGLLYLLQL
jgi:hypothetical protein